MSDDYDLLNIGGEPGSKDVKFNIFHFQDHLLRLIGIISDCFLSRDYPSAFEQLQNLYLDSNGFFNEEEVEALDKLWEDAQDKTTKYVSYNQNYNNIKQRVRNQSYSPPQDLYQSLVIFRKKLMEIMCKHQLLIPQVNKSFAGAGGKR